MLYPILTHQRHERERIPICSTNSPSQFLNGAKKESRENQAQLLLLRHQQRRNSDAERSGDVKESVKDINDPRSCVQLGTW